MKKYIEIPAEALENIENDKYVKGSEEGSYHPPTGERLAEGECDTHQVL